MNKYDDIFNQYFHGYNFKNEEEKESSRLLFNKLMDQFKNSEFDLLDDDSLLTESLKMNFPMLQSTDDIDKLIEKYNLVLVDIDIINSPVRNLMVVESWVSEKQGYSMNISYTLNKAAFSTKDKNSKNMIIEKLYENELDVIEYVNMLPVEEQLSYYDTMLKECVEVENYEKAAEFRDMINSLNSEL